MATKLRDRIVSSAIRCFAESGYHGASTKDIASRANVTEGSLFRVCCSKEKLFGEALSSVLSRKKLGRVHLRLCAFALLEGKGIDEQKARMLKRLAKNHPLIDEVRTVAKL